MLAIQKQPKYFDKLITMPNGQVVLVTFELVERNGHIIAKAIHAEPFKTPQAEDESCYLPGLKSPSEFIPIKSVFVDFFTDLTKDFSFVMSQPTRAPSLS
jgi:hypothetical protein